MALSQLFGTAAAAGEEAVDSNLVYHSIATLSFRNAALEAEYLGAVAQSRWPVLMFIMMFDVVCYAFRIAAKCTTLYWRTGEGLPSLLVTVFRDMGPQCASMIVLYLLIGLLNRRSKRLGDTAARQEELLLSVCMACAICSLLASLTSDNSSDYVYAAYFLICTSTFLKIRWWVGTSVMSTPVAVAKIWHRGSAAVLLPGDAMVHIVVAWAVGGLMAYLVEWYRRQMFTSQKMASAAHQKELLEAQARIRAQRQLAAAQAQAAHRALSVAREKASNEAKSEFMSLMCHEVRTPLNGCLASAEMLLETPLTDEQHELAKTICVSGSILLSTVSNFLDFFKLEAGKALDIVRAEVNLKSLVSDVHCIIEAMIGRNGQVCLLDPQMSGMPEYVVCDPDRVRGILLNLYTNAAKFTKQGHIGLRVREVARGHVPLPQEEGYAVVTAAPATMLQQRGGAVAAGAAAAGGPAVAVAGGQGQPAAPGQQQHRSSLHLAPTGAGPGMAVGPGVSPLGSVLGSPTLVSTFSSPIMPSSAPSTARHTNPSSLEPAFGFPWATSSPSPALAAAPLAHARRSAVPAGGPGRAQADEGCNDARPLAGPKRVSGDTIWASDAFDSEGEQSVPASAISFRDGLGPNAGAQAAAPFATGEPCVGAGVGAGAGTGAADVAGAAAGITGMSMSPCSSSVTAAESNSTALAVACAPASASGTSHSTNALAPSPDPLPPTHIPSSPTCPGTATAAAAATAHAKSLFPLVHTVPLQTLQTLHSLQGTGSTSGGALLVQAGALAPGLLQLASQQLPGTFPGPESVSGASQAWPQLGSEAGPHLAPIATGRSGAGFGASPSVNGSGMGSAHACSLPSSPRISATQSKFDLLLPSGSSGQPGSPSVSAMSRLVISGGALGRSLGLNGTVPGSPLRSVSGFSSSAAAPGAGGAPSLRPVLVKRAPSRRRLERRSVGRRASRDSVLLANQDEAVLQATSLQQLQYTRGRSPDMTPGSGAGTPLHRHRIPSSTPALGTDDGTGSAACNSPSASSAAAVAAAAAAEATAPVGRGGGADGVSGSGSNSLDDSRWLLFEVMDTGVGITPEGLKSLFKEYVQGTEDEMRKPRSKGGTGLGLSICSKQVGVLGGRIGAYSCPGKGSVFWFTMPLLTAPRGGPSACASAPSAPDDGGLWDSGAGQGEGYAAVQASEPTQGQGQAAQAAQDNAQATGASLMPQGGATGEGAGGEQHLEASHPPGALPLHLSAAQSGIRGGDAGSSGSVGSPASASSLPAQAGSALGATIGGDAAGVGGAGAARSGVAGMVGGLLEGQGGDRSERVPALSCPGSPGEHAFQALAPAGAAPSLDAVAAVEALVPSVRTSLAPACSPAEAAAGSSRSYQPPSSAPLPGWSEHPPDTDTGPSAAVEGGLVRGGGVPSASGSDRDALLAADALFSTAAGPGSSQGPGGVGEGVLGLPERLAPPAAAGDGARASRDGGAQEGLSSLGASCPTGPPPAAFPWPRLQQTSGSGTSVAPGAGAGPSGVLERLPEPSSSLGASAGVQRPLSMGRSDVAAPSTLPLFGLPAMGQGGSAGLGAGLRLGPAGGTAGEQAGSVGGGAPPLIGSGGNGSSSSGNTSQLGRLLLTPGLPNPSSRRAADACAVKGLRALLVEDNLINQTVARKMLNSLGMQCKVASNGMEAVDAIQSALAQQQQPPQQPPQHPAVAEGTGAGDAATHPAAAAAAAPQWSTGLGGSGGGGGIAPYDVILMDMSMPVMGGVDATRAIRQLGCQVPIVAMTANASDKDRDECQAAGMDGFLSKPVLKDRLAEAIVLAMDQSRARGERGGGTR